MKLTKLTHFDIIVSFLKPPDADREAIEFQCGFSIVLRLFSVEESQ